MQEAEQYWLKKPVIRSAVASFEKAIWVRCSVSQACRGCNRHLRLYAASGSRATQCQPQSQQYTCSVGGKARFVSLNVRFCAHLSISASSLQCLGSGHSCELLPLSLGARIRSSDTANGVGGKN